ncbi:hypothetical protein PJWF_00079 [Achromobacter phage JWF]|uniref:DNA topoisomerase n=1 Tax=Achromobacter phage JWF TaxID=1589748 RepID=UPI000588E185|nr:DNA topoisomerase [Achromobacter phage JWF]AJD82972.1 hypothetical protein PJWF_00079 [Achromobacter phage JWF]
MKQAYINKRFNRSSMELIAIIHGIGEEYAAMGLILTTRQAYYQLVARAHVENTMKSYKRVAGLINDAKMAGLLDWDWFEDRTRAFDRRGTWTTPSQMVEACSNQFYMDMWRNQDRRVFVIIEKEALVGVLADVCHQFGVPILAARGYPSSTVLRDFAETTLKWKSSLVLHLGDHDPSGIDMTRDLLERLETFAGHRFELRRLALNMEQVEEQNPPENPAKTTDARFESYAEQFGESSWELDALEPRYLSTLVRRHIVDEINPDRWVEREAEILEGRQALKTAMVYINDGTPDYDDQSEVPRADYPSALIGEDDDDEDDED